MSFADLKAQMASTWRDAAEAELEAADLIETRRSDGTSLFSLPGVGRAVVVASLLPTAPEHIKTRLAWFAFAALSGKCLSCGQVADVLPSPPRLTVVHASRCPVPDIDPRWAADRDAYDRLTAEWHQLGVMG